MPGSALFALERGPERPGRAGEAGQEGARPVMVMVHGAMDRHSSFSGVRRGLAHLRTIVYDRRGYGRSRRLPLASSLDDHVEDLLGLCAGRPSVVVGHSYGGCIGLRAAEVAPEVVRAVAAYEPPLPWLDGWPADTGSARALAAADPASGVETFLRHVLDEGRWDGLPERARSDRRGEGPALLADLLSVRPQAGRPPPLDLAAITAPVVVGRGTRSPAYLRAGAERLVGLLGDAELWVVEGAGHAAHLSCPGQIAAMARRAVDRAAAGS